MSKYWNLSAPITVHVEITDACNECCKHCYNFNRSEKKKASVISKENLNYLIDEFVNNKVMHVIITGGEPLLALTQLSILTRRVLDAGMTVSLNSNMKAANPSALLVLKEIGISHILTTIHSHKKEVHDYITGMKGDFDLTVNNIQESQNIGIRISVNTILSDYNKTDIYKIGEFVYSIGVRNFLANRTIPSPSNTVSLEKEYCVDITDALRMFDDLLKIKKDFGMSIGTCRTVPQCLFGNVDVYKEFTNRGCAAGKKHLLLNVNGDAHACVSDPTVYGNVYEDGLKQVWKNMKRWRTLDFIPQECQGCEVFNQCDAGCRMVALHHTGEINGCDNLRRGWCSEQPRSKSIDRRDEKGFSIIRVRGAKVIFVDDKK